MAVDYVYIERSEILETGELTSKVFCEARLRDRYHRS